MSTGLEELASAYEGLEAPSSFPDAASIERYRQALLARTAPQADFLIQHLPEAGRVLEIACGNGRLLIELARRRAFESALGIDVAQSRIAFAEQWAADEGCTSVEFVSGDALAYQFREESFNAVVLITGAFGYFEVIAPGTAAALAERIYRTLQPNGFVCLEIYPHPRDLRLLEATEGELRIWSELPEDDPWRFYLSALSLDESGRILTHDKTFIHRATGRLDAGRRERLYLYSREAVTRLLVAAGFREVRALEGWSSTPYQSGEVMVVTARK